MAREVVVAGVGTINRAKLWADCRAVSPMFAGFSQRPNTQGLILIFEDKATDTEIAAVQDLVLTHNPTLRTLEQQARADLKAVAQSAVGVSYVDLTTAQLKALLAVLIMESGGLGNDLTIKPLNEWVR